MKRITVLFDDETLYRRLKVEAARQGRPVKAVVAEALNDWLLRKGLSVSPEVTRRRLEALERAKELLASQSRSPESILETLDAIREERS